MATPRAIATAIAYLVSIYGRGKLPSEEDIIAEAWLELFNDVADDALADSVRAHVRTSAWWPTPSELLATIRTPARDHAATWDVLVRRISAGRYSVIDLLTAEESHALQAIGGTWTIRAADSERQLPDLRRRWLAALAGPTTDTRAIAARAGLRALTGGRDDG